MKSNLIYSLKHLIIFSLNLLFFSLFLKLRFNPELKSSLAELLFILIPASLLLKYNGMKLKLSKIQLLDIILICGSAVSLVFINIIMNASQFMYLVEREQNLNSFLAFITCVFSSAIIPSVSEELYFRAFWFDFFKKNGIVLSIIISSIFFSLFHLSPDKFLQTFLFALYAVYIYHITKNILVPIVMHFSYNFMIIVLIKLYENNADYIHFSKIYFLFFSFIFIFLNIIFMFRINSKKQS